jgi:hypothetical protein
MKFASRARTIARVIRRGRGLPVTGRDAVNHELRICVEQGEKAAPAFRDALQRLAAHLDVFALPRYPPDRMQIDVGPSLQDDRHLAAILIIERRAAGTTGRAYPEGDGRRSACR